MGKILPCLSLFVILTAGKDLKPEEHWRPAIGKDLSKYRPRIEKYKGSSSLTSILRNATIPKPYEGAPRNFDDICGIENDGHDPRENRIVGGFEAEEHQWPWIVALFIDDMWFCGGALITDDFVLTAAHCAEDAYTFEVWAGAHNVRASSEPERIEITSHDGWTHPQWDSNDLSNDLALIRLPEKITFTDNIRPSCLPKAGQTADPGMVVTPIGWADLQILQVALVMFLEWLKIYQSLPMLNVMLFMELLVMELFALTLLGGRAHAVETVVAHWECMMNPLRDGWR